jgi:hypothetical protein
LLCICCKKEHLVIRPGKSTVVCFSDQNFVPILPADNGNCIAIVRLENATLKELVDFSFEIFSSLPENTVLCFGSASYLYRVGSSLYAQEWSEINNKISGKWRTVSVVPLIAIITENCPGILARDIEQIATWFGNVYSSDVRGMLDSWRGVLQATKNNCEGSEIRETCEIFKNPMPVLFTSVRLEQHCFVTNSTCPALLRGMDRKATDALVRAFLENLHKNFLVPNNPEDFLVRVTDKTDCTKEEASKTTYIVIGSSITNRVVGHLRALNIPVIDLTVPGWLATQDNIDSLIAKLAGLDCPDDFVVVMDLHSNSSYRFKQFDGTPALPVKDCKKYHFPGEILLTDDMLFKKITASLAPVLLSAQNKIKVLIPPPPQVCF